MSASSSVARSAGEPQTPARAARAPWFKLTPDDGWLSFALLAAIVFTTVSSIQAVTPAWAPGLSILTAITAAGLFLSYVVVQQGILPSGVAHVVAIGLGVYIAFDQTAHAVLAGDRLLLLQRVGTWFHAAFIKGQGSNDNAVFLLFLAILTFLLAYISYWLVVQTRRPWLAVLANGTVLMINLNWATDTLVVYLVLFLLAALLLLVRSTLTENMRTWRARGLRFSPDLSWDFMQAGAIFAVVVLLLAYVLPVGSANAQVLHFLNDPEGVWQQVQQRAAGIFGGVVGPKGSSGFGAFDPEIVLVGNVDLPQTQIMHYSPGAGSDPTQYLVAASYDTYDGIRTWTQSATDQRNYGVGDALPAPSDADLPQTYILTFDSVTPASQHFLVAPGVVAAQFSVPYIASLSSAAAMPTSWQAQQALKVGQSILASGYVPQVSEVGLRAVPYPAQAQQSNAAGQAQYPANVLTEYLPPDNPISPGIQQIAVNVTKGSTNMYDAAVAIEDYLRTFTYSTQNPDPPAGQDATLWFLHEKQGYCTFFASAMALMGRSLGMPTRVVSGFIAGTYDTASGSYIVRASASHAWTQVYFAGYGWVNFEPTSTFDKFSRSTGQPTSTPTTGTATPTGSRTPSVAKTPDDGGSNGVGPGTNDSSGPLRIALGGSVVLLLLMVAAALALAWWRLLFRGLPPAAAFFGRIARLGTWAGAPPGRSQTPLEYADHLGEMVPGYRGVFRQLGNAYARERYGGGVPPGVARQLPSLYDEVRGRLAQLIGQRLFRSPLTLLRLRRRHASRDADDT